MKMITMVYPQNNFIKKCISLIKPKNQLEKNRLYTLIDTYLDNCIGVDIEMPQVFIEKFLNGKIFYKEQELENFAKVKNINLNNISLGEDIFDNNFRLLKDKKGYFGYYF